MLDCDSFRQYFSTNQTEVSVFYVFRGQRQRDVRYYDACALTCNGGEFEQVSVQVDVHPGAVVGQCDAGAVPPDCQVLVETEDQTSQPDLHGLSPGKGTSAPSVVLH